MHKAKFGPNDRVFVKGKDGIYSVTGYSHAVAANGVTIEYDLRRGDGLGEDDSLIGVDEDDLHPISSKVSMPMPKFSFNHRVRLAGESQVYNIVGVGQLYAPGATKIRYTLRPIWAKPQSGNVRTVDEDQLILVSDLPPERRVQTLSGQFGALFAPGTLVRMTDRTGTFRVHSCTIHSSPFSVRYTLDLQHPTYSERVTNVPEEMVALPLIEDDGQYKDTSPEGLQRTIAHQAQEIAKLREQCEVQTRTISRQAAELMDADALKDRTSPSKLETWNANLRADRKRLWDENERLKKQVDSLKETMNEEAEHIRLAFVAIESAAACNTRDSANATRLSPQSPLVTPAYRAVCAAVDREMNMREELEAIERSEKLTPGKRAAGFQRKIAVQAANISRLTRENVQLFMRLLAAYKELGISHHGVAANCVPCQCGGFREPGNPTCGATVGTNAPCKGGLTVERLRALEKRTGALSGHLTTACERLREAIGTHGEPCGPGCSFRINAEAFLRIAEPAARKEP